MSESVSSGVHLLGGLSHVINTSNTSGDVDFEEIEKSMIAGGDITNIDQEPSDDLENELKKISEQLGFSLDDTQTEGSSDFLNSKSSVSINDYVSSEKTDTLNMDGLLTSSEPSSSSYGSSEPSSSSYGSSSSSYGSSEPSSSSYGSSSSYSSSHEPLTHNPLSYGSSSYQPSLNSLSQTNEELRHNITRGVVQDLGNDSSSKIFSLENERAEHERSLNLEKIDELRRILKSEKIDLSAVPDVNNNSTDEQIDSSLRMLILKNDRIRFHTVAEEVILMGAHALEEMFDGKRVWLGKYKPDLVGWNTHVSSKLRRMRYDTSTIVSNIMNEYNIGSVGRIALELIPNAFAYSRKKKRRSKSDSLYTREQAESARTGIRDRTELF